MPISTERLKQIYITKGKIRADVSYVMWDLCSKCLKDDCPLAERCQYVKKGFCSVESHYLNAITAPVLKLLDGDCEARLTEMDWLDFGLKMIPLYHDLIKAKKVAAALDNILIDSSHGVKMHPIFKEKRDIIKAIDSLSITKVLRDKFSELGIKDITLGKDSSIDELMEQEGDPDFVDSLMDKGGDGEVIRDG